MLVYAHRTGCSQLAHPSVGLNYPLDGARRRGLGISTALLYPGALVLILYVGASARSSKATFSISLFFVSVVWIACLRSRAGLFSFDRVGKSERETRSVRDVFRCPDFPFFQMFMVL